MIKKRIENIAWDAYPPQSVWVNILKTAVALAAAILLEETLLHFQMGGHYLILFYILSVLIISQITPGYIYGVASTFISALTYDFLVMEPRFQFGFTIGFPITLCVMLLVSFIISALTTQIKTQAKLAQDKEHRAQLLYEINQKLLAAPDLDAIVRLTNDYIISHLRRPVGFYTCDPLSEDSGVFEWPCGYPGEDLPFRSETVRKAAHQLYTAQPDSFGEQIGAIFFAPVNSKGVTLGLVGVSCEKGSLDQSSILFLQTLIGQVALALELQFLSAKQRRILLETEREKMRGTLLRAISHDLRTPLTSILGASSAILEQEKKLDEKTVEKLVMDIRENSQWLVRMVENLLSVTRISEDTPRVEKTLEAVEEVVAQSVSIVRKRFPYWQIHVRAPEELLMAPMEATLISQVIINLLENSIKNSREGSLILVDVRRQGDFVAFDVSDNGRGIPEDLLDNLFETHSPDKRQAVDSVRGMGIGLSICKTIIKAHGGTIVGENKPDGGARFSFQLPMVS